MKIRYLFILLVLVAISCSRTKYPENTFLISTTMGDMIVQLYDETPLHRDNFNKLIEEKYYDGILFHRVIDSFMIQAGDPTSRNAEKGAFLGEGGPGYRIPAEFVDTIFHKKGVIAAAREGDDVNPDKESDGSQFYIVQGKIFTDEELDLLEYSKKSAISIRLQTEYIKEESQKMMDAGEDIDNNIILERVQHRIEAELEQNPTYKISAEKRSIYRTIGGTPHLDGNYTVFGVVLEGVNVIDSIAGVQTDERDRPLENVIITKIKKLN